MYEKWDMFKISSGVFVDIVYFFPGQVIHMYYELEVEEKAEDVPEFFDHEGRCLNVLSLRMKQKMRVWTSLMHLCENMLVPAVHKK